MIDRRKFLCGIAAGLIPFAEASGRLGKVQHAEPCMGTLFSVTVDTPEESAAYEAIRKAFQRAHQLDATLSDYRPESELSALMREGYSKPFRASGDLFRVVSIAQNLSGETGGLFDITIGPLTRLWRRARKDKQLPDSSKLVAAKEKVGYRFVKLSSHSKTISLQKPGMQLDLGGVAKGFAADEMLSVLRQEGFPSALVSAAGDITAGDAPDGMEGWRVLLMPGKPTAASNVVLSLARRSVSTSGAFRQNVVIGGVSYSHILDPRTGLGLTDPVAVTVVAPSAMESDSLATAASVMGAEGALRFLSGRDAVEARILRERENGLPPEIRTTPGFERLLPFRRTD